jgi:SAM-dependent methyltransferase
MLPRVKRHAAAAERNRGPILEVLRRVLPARGLVLELASGTGQHAAHFAAALPGVSWQPSDLDLAALASIEAWRVEAALPNLRPPVALDVAAARWPVEAADAVVAINLVHIAPWEVALALLARAAAVLPPGGVLCTYGPYRFDGVTAPSNEEFDRSLRARDPAWGVRDVSALRREAADRGLRLDEVVAMPANNHALVFRLGDAPGEPA